LEEELAPVRVVWPGVKGKESLTNKKSGRSIQRGRNKKNTNSGNINKHYKFIAYNGKKKTCCFQQRKR